VTKTLLEQGSKLQAFNLHRSGRILGRLDFSAVRHRFPFMLILSQSKTEEILEQALFQRSIRVEREAELVGLSIDTGNTAHLNIRNKAGERSAVASCVFGADGSRSRVREALGIKFDGHAYDARICMVALRVDFDARPKRGDGTR
jgi:2-polyprenyl-6-methoxyphenol hydroxylase-like FAD-dependent oxidoreductase